jgi:hypothetical protein
MSHPADDTQVLLANAKLLAARLERLSADSAWAHRASGVRGQILRALTGPQPDYETLAAAVAYGFWVLENAAREIVAPAED